MSKDNRHFILPVILLIMGFFHVEPANEIEPVGLKRLEWGWKFQSSGSSKGLLKMPKNYSHPILRSKRYLYLGNESQMPNKSYQSCIAPGERPGHCRRLNYCVLEDYRRNFVRFLDYMCIIEHLYVGVCCPDTEKEAFRINSLEADNSHEFVPAFPDNDKPVWDVLKESSEENNNSDNQKTLRMMNDESTREPRETRGCGMNIRSWTRVVGGQPADPNEWPWMVALIRKYSEHFCGGVLITNRHVLTAAHCVYGVQVKDIKVRLGEYDFTKPDETRALDFHVNEIRIHEDFNLYNYNNDIALLKIHRPTVFNSYIWPICLPPTGATFERKSAIVTGWGSQYYAGPPSSILMAVPVPVWSNDLCTNSLVHRASDRVLCAGAYEGGRDSCQGDSGGPLLHQLANGRWVNIGIVSWGFRCGEPGHPGVYTSVSSYLDWIFANAIF